MIRTLLDSSLQLISLIEKIKKWSHKKNSYNWLSKIGTAHLRSFLKFKDINYFLVDRDKNKLLMIKKMMVKAKHKNFLLSNKLPSNINFDFVIISTDPKDRFTIFKN